MTLRIGASLPVRELSDDLDALGDFASLAEELGCTHLRIPERIVRKDALARVHRILVREGHIDT